MAYIGHRCGCGHADIHHQPGAARTTCQAIAGASCGRGCRKSTKSLLLPTFDGRGRKVERIIAPGDRWGIPAGTGMQTCSCDNCQALYAKLAADA